MKAARAGVRGLSGPRIVLQIAGYALFVVAGVNLLQDPFRALESRLSVELLLGLGVDQVYRAGDTAIGIVPSGTGPAFLALVTPACSCLSSLLALIALSHHMNLRRRTFALAVALATVFCGNILRIAGSALVGVQSTRGGLLLFHDSVGSAFAFGYTIAGYCLILYLVLPVPSGKVSTRPWYRPLTQPSSSEGS